MGVDVRVGRQGLSLKVLYDCSHNRRVRRHASLEVVSYDGEIRGRGVLVCQRVVFSGLEDRF